MSILLGIVLGRLRKESVLVFCDALEHSPEGLEGLDREAAGGNLHWKCRQARCSDGDEALNAGSKPDHAHPSEDLFGRHAQAGKGEAIQRVRRVDDGNLLSRRDAYAK